MHFTKKQFSQMLFVQFHLINVVTNIEVCYSQRYRMYFSLIKHVGWSFFNIRLNSKKNGNEVNFHHALPFACSPVWFNFYSKGHFKVWGNPTFLCNRHSCRIFGNFRLVSYTRHILFETNASLFFSKYLIVI